MYKYLPLGAKTAKYALKLLMVWMIRFIRISQSSTLLELIAATYLLVGLKEIILMVFLGFSVRKGRLPAGNVQNLIEFPCAVTMVLLS